MAPARTPNTRRTTRSRTGSPYTGRPDAQSSAVARRAESGTPKTQQQQKQSSSHRYGLRSMLSNLFWGSPVKRVDETEENVADDQDDVEGEASVSGDEQALQVISDDEDQEPSMPSLNNSQYDPSRYEPPQRLSAAQKGKGRAQGNEVQRSLNQTNHLSPKRALGGLRNSQTLGDLRSVQHDFDDDATMDVATSTPTVPRTQVQEPQSPAEINSQLASFFAAKGTATLTADERKRISEILLGGSGQTQSTNVPTALTPNFSFSVPLPSTVSPNVSIISPAYQGLRRSNSTVQGLSSLPPKPTGGLTGSQSLSSLSSLAAAADGSTALGSAASNPRSALNRRQARPQYLGAGYSSQAIARRKRMQAQMNNLYGNLETFDSSTTNPPAPTPGKRRRLDETAGTSSASPAAQTNSPKSVDTSINAPPPFSSAPTKAPGTSGSSSRSSQQTSFLSHINHQQASLPARPSPLAQTSSIPASSPPGTPAQRGDSGSAPASQPRTVSKTAGLMRGILGDTSEPVSQTKSKTNAQTASSSTPNTISISRTHEEPTRVPREKLIRRTEQPSAAEILERTAPAEVRSNVNGKQVRPKPPPVPGSARKTRAAQAAAEKEERAKKQQAAEEAKQSLKAPARTRSKSKTPTETTPQPAPEVTARAESSQAASRHATPAQNESNVGSGTSRDSSAPRDSPAPASATAPRAAFEFKSPAALTPAPTLFSKEAVKPPTQANPGPAHTQEKPTQQPMFSFAPPKAQENITAPALPATTIAKPQPVNEAMTAVDHATARPQASEDAPPAEAADPKKVALSMSAVTLPTFTLYDFGFSLSQTQTGDDDDAKTKAIKQTVLEMPASEITLFNLL